MHNGALRELALLAIGASLGPAHARLEGGKFDAVAVPTSLEPRSAAPRGGAVDESKAQAGCCCGGEAAGTRSGGAAAARECAAAGVACCAERHVGASRLSRLKA